MDVLDGYPLQGCLFGDSAPALGRLADRARTQLDECCWIDWYPGWMHGTDRLLDRLVGELGWATHRRPMYDRMVDVPRLTCSRDIDDPMLPAPVPEAGRRLADHYGVAFDEVGFSLYRDGRDSVAWHGDRIGRVRRRAVVAVVSLGSARPFRIRPVGGGPSHRFDPGHGDLLVMGGACQLHWQHSVPKSAHAQPRLSMVFRAQPAVHD